MTGKFAIGAYKAGQEYYDDVAQSGASIGFLFNDALAGAQSVKAQNPAMTLIGRFFFDNQLATISGITPRQDGYGMAQALVMAYPDIDVWQGLNELHDPKNPYRLRRQVEYELGMADYFAEVAKGLCAENAGPGTVPTNDPDDTARALWPEYLDITRPLRNHPGVRFWGWHAYAKPVDPRCLLTVEPEWYGLRHLKFVKSLEDAGEYCPPIVITELGQHGGWRGWISEAQAFDDFAFIAARLGKNCAADIPFLDGDCGGWADYDIYGMRPQIVTWNAANPAGEVTAIGVRDMQITEIDQKIQQLLNQNAAITDALIALREGRFTGPGSVDGYIAALRGGSLPDGYAPVFPKA